MPLYLEQNKAKTLFGRGAASEATSMAPPKGLVVKTTTSTLTSNELISKAPVQEEVAAAATEETNLTQAGRKQNK